MTACEGKLESQINFHLLRLMDTNPPGFMVPAMPEYKTSSRLSPEKEVTCGGVQFATGMRATVRCKI